MRKTVVMIFFSIFFVAIFAQDLENPRIKSTNSVSYTFGNYLLFIDPDKYIKPSEIDIRDLENLLKDWSDVNAKIAAQEKQLNKQKREIEELIELVETQQRQLDEQKRAIEEIQRKMK